LQTLQRRRDVGEGRCHRSVRVGCGRPRLSNGLPRCRRRCSNRLRSGLGPWRRRHTDRQCPILDPSPLDTRLSRGVPGPRASPPHPSIHHGDSGPPLRELPGGSSAAYSECSRRNAIARSSRTRSSSHRFNAHTPACRRPSEPRATVPRPIGREATTPALRGSADQTAGGLPVGPAGDPAADTRPRRTAPTSLEMRRRR
jgi:hypothetical protein